MRLWMSLGMGVGASGVLCSLRFMQIAVFALFPCFVHREHCDPAPPPSRLRLDWRNARDGCQSGACPVRRRRIHEAFLADGPQRGSFAEDYG